MVTSNGISQKASFLKGVYIVSAPWVLPVCQPPIRNGSVVVKDGKIIDVGRSELLRNKWATASNIICTGLLMPALINAHTHLELSHLRDVPRPAPGQVMVDWIENLLQQRQQLFDENLVTSCSSRVISNLFDSGCAVVGDIRNNPEFHSNQELNFPEIYSFLECLGPTQSATKDTLSWLDKIETEICVTAHAPYSTSPALLTYLKDRTIKNNHIFSLHIAESKEEHDFVVHGRGPFREFLERRDRWDSTFPEFGVESHSVVEYLDTLELLDDSTLCVHCVHVSEEDVELLSSRGVNVCLCPGSNAFLRVGKAPVEYMLKHGITPGLGTDSLASNWDIDLWHEMKTLSLEHSSVSPEDILKMATLGGAKCLHKQEYGVLEKNKIGAFLNIADDDYTAIKNEDVMYEKLVTSGRPESIQWVRSLIEGV